MSSPSFTVYVSCLEGRAVEVFRSDFDTGAMEKLQTIGLSGKGNPLALSPDGRRLYASVIGERDGVEEPRIESFAAAPHDGRLTHLSTVTTVGRMAHLYVDRSGGFLLAASFPSSLIAVHPLGDRGHAQANPVFTMATPARAHQIITDPSNRFAFVPNLGADLVMQFLFDERTGTLRENGPPAVHLQAGAGCRHLAFHPDRRHVYLMNELDGSIVVYRLDTDRGTLSEIDRGSALADGFDGKPWGAQIHVTPDGKQLFATERRANTLARWDIDVQTGRLSNRLLTGTGGNPRCFDIDPSGSFLALGSLEEASLDVYDIRDRAAEPKLIGRHPTAAQPGWVEIAAG